MSLIAFVALPSVLNRFSTTAKFGLERSCLLNGLLLAHAAAKFGVQRGAIHLTTYYVVRQRTVLGACTTLVLFEEGE